LLNSLPVLLKCFCFERINKAKMKLIYTKAQAIKSYLNGIWRAILGQPTIYSETSGSNDMEIKTAR
jgi:hypothetical protein